MTVVGSDLKLVFLTSKGSTEQLGCKTAAGREVEQAVGAGTQPEVIYDGFSEPIVCGHT